MMVDRALAERAGATSVARLVVLQRAGDGFDAEASRH